MLNKLAIAAAVAAAVTGSAYAQQTTGVGTPTQAQVLTTLPTNATTVTNYYKQNVYDPSDAKIGEITDVLVDKGGKVQGDLGTRVSHSRRSPLNHPRPCTPAAPAAGVVAFDVS